MKPPLALAAVCGKGQGLNRVRLQDGVPRSWAKSGAAFSRHRYDQLAS